MWQLICLCLPALALSERRRFFTLFGKALQEVGEQPGEIDIGLFFLHSLSPAEALTVLEGRRDLVIRSQELVEQWPEKDADENILEFAIDDHIQTLLAAERRWLDRTIARLQILDTHTTLLKKEKVS
jgi:hypothetical protein